MPELPEVEVTRLSFASRISHAVIERVNMGKALRWPLGCLPETLVGLQVLQVRRRGKYLLFDLSNGSLLLVHLGMSGSLAFVECKDNLPIGQIKHIHFEMVTSQGTLRLNDPRRFGAVVFATSPTDAVAVKLLGRLGVEPLEALFDATDFYHSLKKSNAPIKQLLLAGQVVVGVGNIYASEALFEAGIRPAMPASRISKPRAARLHQAIQKVLAQAVATGGSTLRDFSNAQGEPGHFQQEAMVYGRAGLPCRLCTTPIKTVRQGQRSTFYCSHCQKP